MTVRTTSRRAGPGRDLPPAAPGWTAALRELARDLPLTVAVRGGCMAPLLGDGERVAVVPARRYWPGDVLAFRDSAGRLVAHRLLGYRPLGGRLALVTRGDRCPCVDSPVPPERVIGRVAFRDGGEPLAVPAAARLRCLARFAGLALGGLLRRWGLAPARVDGPGALPGPAAPGAAGRADGWRSPHAS